MEKHFVKRRKIILRGIELQRNPCMIQPIQKFHRDFPICVELVGYYKKRSKVYQVSKVIPDLEKNISIVILDLYMFEKLCKELSTWRKDYNIFIHQHLRLSHITLLPHDLITQLEVIGNRYEVNTNDIGIIVTYQEDLQEHKVINFINNLHQQGYIMILGNKENKLDLLSKAMFSMVKFEFVQFLKAMEEKRNITDFYHFMSWCKEEHIEVMFGGIQNELQRKNVQNIGCSYMVAPYLQKEVSLEEFGLRLKQQYIASKYDTCRNGRIGKEELKPYKHLNK